MITDLEDNWYCLIEELEKGNVIPIVGPELLEIPDGPDGVSALLYDLVARELAARYNHASEEKISGAWSLHNCVAALLASGQVNVDKLRRAAAKTIDTLSATCPLPKALQTLAAIDAFDLYVSLTCDPLLFRSLQNEDPSAESFAFGIRSDTNSHPLDIPAKPRGKICYQLLGSAENLLDFAIHEGDVLEYLYRLQSEQTRSIKNLLGRLRSSNLLFIGCHLPDWVGRSLLRVVNEDPLLSKAKQEFMTDFEGDPSLATFLSRFSPNSLVFPGSQTEFVEELAKRWQTWRLANPRAGDQRAALKPAPATEGPMIFISYASQNADAARSIADQLLALGAGDVWLDKKKLRGGDDWSNKLDEAIGSCDYFLPLLSSEADERREGVFWKEWGTALERAREVADTFILPTLIDPTPDSRNNYQRVGKELGTERFWSLHLLNAPQGTFDDKAGSDLTECFERFRRH